MTLDWRNQMRHNPFGTTAAGAAVVLGGLGLVLGADVSQGMTNSLRGSADIVAHLWGGAFAAGGVLKLVGLYRHRSEVEIPGLWMLTGGYAFYSITVTVGLGVHGLAAGTISAALTIGCLLKARNIMRSARMAARLRPRPDGS
ncbi:hypothetical protein FHS43_006160 [Streptosporangium becharense]|uniref:DUF4383 domain-containing protein n=1 Tax=Streptosporangium becharense TaxID=1816182 RepID=A0A7W9IHE3_9ACTN|nr:hypothetical protein [Streptosporangium becharense]MBB2914848.1 hypothetical protein [Streptosporangium becharense]MBB5820341.1 hypothetical protein [Streptosporangium becharense]